MIFEVTAGRAVARLTSYTSPSCVTISCDVNPCNIYLFIYKFNGVRLL